jgi:rhamnulose-1-phosphate aldolase/alcohol dehydrogenase
MTIAPPEIAGETELERLVSRSRLIGADPRLVLHGGGNTSTKLVEEDHLGRERRVLRVKGTGADLATITAGGFPGLYLDELHALADRDQMSDDELVAYLGRCLVDPSSPRPSIETLLHAFIPAAHVDHTHSDAVCALTNHPGGVATVKEALGEDVAVVPYVRPGFQLAKLAATRAGSTAIVLLHHGTVTWGETQEETLAATLELERRARGYLAEHTPAVSRSAAGDLDDELLLPRLRGLVSRRSRRVLHVDPGQRAIADRPDVEAVATAARSSPDHMLRIGRETLLVEPGREAEAVEAYEERRAAARTRFQDAIPPGAPELDPTPRVALVPGLGCVGAGATPDEARRNAEIASHSHASVAASLDAFGEVAWITEREVAEFEYWPLELYKLSLLPPPLELTGHVVLVSGAASGIGREVAADLAARGASVVLSDLEADGLAVTSAGLPEGRAVVVPGDMTSERDVAELVAASVESFGGLDAIVSNAGVAVTGRLEELSTDEWERSMAVNAGSHFLLTRAAWPVLKAQGIGGSLVYVASKNAFSPGAGFGAYSAAKAAEIQVARIAALEGGELGIRSNVVNPDAIFGGSRLWSEELRRERAREHGVEPDELESFYAGRNLLRHRVTSADVAEAVAFLVSDRSRATTGCVLTVDGGVAGAFPR